LTSESLIKIKTKNFNQKFNFGSKIYKKLTPSAGLYKIKTCEVLILLGLGNLKKEVAQVGMSLVGFKYFGT